MTDDVSSPPQEGGTAADGIDDLTDLVVVSNREPYQHRYDDGDVVVDEPVGGLTAALDPVVQQTNGTWVAWGDAEADPDVTNAEDCVGVPPDDEQYTLRRVWLSEDAVEEYYYGYSNRVLWPLCHDLVGKVTVESDYWDRYSEVNRQFAEAAAERATADSTVWIQDYHLCLAPRMMRELLPASVTVAQFWHIPWPAWDTFRVAPHAEELLEGLLANDLLGFHVDRYRDNFLDCVDQALEDAVVDEETHTVQFGGRTTRVESFEMGVDAATIGSIARSFDDDDWQALADRYGIDTDTKIAVGVDRLDYTKGIPERIEALELFWERHPEWRGELTFVQKSSHSRSQIPAYKRVTREVTEAVERVNDRFGTDDWQPVVHIDDRLSREELYGLFRHSDVALVSPLRDGMNLVAKEYVAAQVDADGVLVLSELAGAHQELGGSAVSVNPHSRDEFADRIEEALAMPDAQRCERMSSLRSHVAANDLDAWVRDVLDTAERTAPVANVSAGSNTDSLELGGSND
jgi:trehalose 6-phosphate synthase